MKLFALLTKELRTRMRRERTAWVLVIYVSSLGLLGWQTINTMARYNTYNSLNSWSSLGNNLYQFLIILQLVLVLLITPAFTATAINGEKERQTFDLLLCSRLSSFALVMGKLFAGLTNTLLLIAASIPLFSLIFFFGGVNPQRILLDLVIFLVTAVFIATLGLCCSTLFTRPAVSTAITYLLILLWVALPLLISFIAPRTTVSMIASQSIYISSSPLRTGPPSTIVVSTPGPTTVNQPPSLPLLYIWNPVALLEEENNPGIYGNFVYSTFRATPGQSNGAPSYQVAGLALSPWIAYLSLSTIATVIFFLLSMALAKPYLLTRLRLLLNARRTRLLPGQETHRAIPA